MALHDIGAVAELEHGPIVASVGYVDLIVWRVGSEIHVTGRWCPHARGDLSVAVPEGGALRCGDHNWSFDIATGACLKKPGRYTLRTYAWQVRGDRIEVELP